MKKSKFSKIFDDKSFDKATTTLTPKTYAKLYKDLKFPRSDYILQATVTKVKPTKRKK